MDESFQIARFQVPVLDWHVRTVAWFYLGESCVFSCNSNYISCIQLRCQNPGNCSQLGWTCMNIQCASYELPLPERICSFQGLYRGQAASMMDPYRPYTILFVLWIVMKLWSPTELWKKNVQVRQAAPASDFSIIGFFPIRVQNIPEVIRTFFFHNSWRWPLFP